jgi:hypothetical protein
MCSERFVGRIMQPANRLLHAALTAVPSAQPGVQRVEARDLHVPPASRFSPEAAAFDGWFCDLTLEEGQQPANIP